MKVLNIIIGFIFVLMISSIALADCPLDHLLIGCNRDGIAGTDDDMKLFVDCSYKYRHSDPDNSGEPTWLNWYYPLYYNERYGRYQIDEPGFEFIEDNDPNRMLEGTPNVDYKITIRCVSVTPGFAVWNSSLGVIFDEPGDDFDFSGFDEPHIHLQYRAGVPESNTDLYWVTFQIIDEIGDPNHYEVSEPVTIVFNKEPLVGDLVVDGTVDIKDIVEFSYYWLGSEGDRANDFYERADANRDGAVDFLDFAMLSSNWHKSFQN